MKYPKLAAAIDEKLATLAPEAIDALIQFLIVEPVPEKIVPIPVTKELVLSEQTEVRNAD